MLEGGKIWEEREDEGGREINREEERGRDRKRK